MNNQSLSQFLLNSLATKAEVVANPKGEKRPRMSRQVRELTPRQIDILNFVKEFIDINKYPPTRREIADYMGCKSANAADEHVKALARKGRIFVAAGISRGIRIL